MSEVFSTSPEPGIPSRTEPDCESPDPDLENVLLETILNSSPDAIFVADAKGCLIKVNDRACQLLNLPREALVGRAMTDFVAAENLLLGVQGNARRETWTQLQQGGNPIAVEVKTQTLPMGGWVAFVRDIRDRLQLEAEQQAALRERNQVQQDLQQSQETIQRQLAELEAIYNTAPVGLAILDRDFRYLRLNQQLAEMNRLAIEDHLGRTVREIVPEVADQVEPFLSRVLETGEPLLNQELNGAIVVQFGVPRTWIASWFPLRDAIGQIIGVNAVVQEITERKQAELSLRQQEQQLEQLSNSMPQFVWIADADGELEYVNQQWSEYTGLTLEQTGDSEWRTKYFHPDDLQAVDSHWAIALAAKQPFEIEARLRRSSDRAYRWFLIRAVPIFDDQGQPLRWYGTSTDIHDRKLSELNERFLKDLDARMRQLPNVAAMEQEVVRSLGEYLNVDRCLWHEIDWENRSTTVAYNWRQADVPDVTGVYALDEYFTPQQFNSFAAGQTLIVSDVKTHPGTASYAQNYLRLGAAAFVSVPCIHAGRWLAVLAVNSRVARGWRSDEVVLLQETVARLWSIIEQTRAVQALRESEERLRLALTAANQGTYDLDVKTGQLAINDNYARMLGYDPETFQESFTSWYERLHPNDQEPARQVYAEYVAGDRPEYRNEFRLQTASGDWIWVLSVGKVIAWDADGNPLRMLGTHTDITARKQAERNEQFLNELDLRLRQLSDADAMAWEVVSSIGNYLSVDYCTWHTVDLEADIITVEQDWRQQTDIPSIVGLYRLSQMLTPELIQHHQAGQAAVVENVTTNAYTAPVSDRYVEIGVRAFIAVPCVQTGRWVAHLTVNSATVRQWRSDEVVLLQETVARLWSIIEQTRAVQALRESESRFRTLADNIAQFAWITDENGWIFWYNQRWFDYTGTTLEEMQGWGWRSVHHPEHVDRVVERFRNCIETGETWEDTFPLRGQDGQYRWFLSRAVPICDEAGSIVRWFGTNTDITERKQAEADLQERSDHIRLLYETSRDLLSTDQPLALVETLFAKLKPLAGIDTYFNYVLDEPQQRLHLAFYSGIEAEIAQAVEWLEFGQAICGTVARQRCQIVLSDLQASTDPMTEAVRSVGLTAYSCQPLTAQDKLFGTLGFGSRSRSQFTAAEVNLFQALCDQIAIALERSELIASLQQQTAELRQINRLKDDFFSALSHELRTPLNPILGWTKLLQSRTFSSEKVTQALETIERNVKHQISLVDDLLDVSRAIQGSLRLNFHPINLTVPLQSAIETVQFSAQAKGIRLQFVHPGSLYTCGDGDRLRQIFWNLLSNAVKYTPEGGQVDVELSIAERNSRHYAQVRIADTGIGIAPDFLPHVFEYFRQAEGGSTRRYNGLGLGLAIVRHLVELHGGTVVAESPGEGQGATFTVTMPLLPDLSVLKPDSSQTDAATVLPASLAGMQILVVDDEEDSRHYVSYVLEQEGVQVFQAASAAEALQILNDSNIDLLISDIGMPNINGHMLIQEIQRRYLSPSNASPTNRPVPLGIALTAYIGAEHQQQAIDAGFQMHIAKPVDPVELVKAVSILVHERTAKMLK